MIQLQTPNGLPVQVPETDNEDPSAKFAVNQISEANDYYEKFGYVVFRNVIEPKDCVEAMALWAAEVKPCSEYIYRQATAQAEKNVLDAHGWVMNPILNLQSISPKHFPGLRKHTVEKVLCAKPLSNILQYFLGDAPRLYSPCTLKVTALLGNTKTATIWILRRSERWLHAGLL